MKSTFKRVISLSMTLAILLTMNIAVFAEAPAGQWFGDLDADGKVNLSDAKLLIVSLMRGPKLTGEAAEKADMNGDGKTNAADVALILQTAFGFVPLKEFQPGETEEFIMGRFDLIVSPAGNDNWSGKLPEPNAEGTDGPLASLAEAKERLKTLVDCDCDLRGLTVWVRGGEYFLDKPLEFTAGDLGQYTFKAYPGEKPVVNGSKPLSGWSAETVNGVAVWSTPVDTGKWFFNTLYNGDKRLPRPRYPKTGELTVASVNHDDELEPESTYFKANTSFNADPKDLFLFKNLGDVDVRILHYWKDDFIPVESYDPATGYLRLSKPTAMTVQQGDRYFFENVFEPLSEPGEWYLDRPAGKLYYVPLATDTFETTVLYAGTLETMVKIDGVNGIGFEGVTFARCEWNIVPRELENSQAAYGVAPAILATNAESVSFTGCTLQNIGASGIKIGLNTENCSVKSCLFYDIGGTAVFIEGRNVQPDDPGITQNITVTDNHIYKYGRVFNNAIGVLLIHARNCEIAKNEIHDGFYTGISAGWVWGYSYNVTDYLKIQDNLIYDIGQGWLADMGGIYTLGMQPHSVVSGNVVHNVGCYSGSSGYGGWGIYLDEGSSYITVENNLAYNCSSQGFHQHYGRENQVRNNIFAMNGDGQVRVSRKEEHISLYLTRNIIVGKDQPMYTSVEKGKFVDDTNIYWDYQRKCVILSGESTRIKDRKYVWGMKLKGYYKNAVIKDPLFAYIENRDFTLSPESPAIKAGFVPWDYTKAGTVTKFELPPRW